MKHDLNYYLNLPYKLEVIPLTEADGGGFYARYSELGEAAAHGDGKSVQEAIRMADEAKHLALEVMLEHGDEVPLPDSLKEYSGKFIVRTPKSLHRNLALEAEREGVSLNQLVVSLLSRSVSRGSCSG